MSRTVVNGGKDPWWSLDFGMDNVPIKELFILGATVWYERYNGGIQVRIGNDASPYANPLC